MNSKICARSVYQESCKTRKRRGSSPGTCNSSSGPSNHKWIARRAGDVPSTLGRQGSVKVDRRWPPPPWTLQESMGEMTSFLAGRRHTRHLDETVGTKYQTAPKKMEMRMGGRA
jgi:hypothetical protein